MSKSYEVITNRIIELLEQGTVPWQKSWGGEQAHPRNLVSDKKYQGINAFLLGSASYDSPYWLTYRQARDRGGHVKKGEKGLPCVFWKWLETEDKQTKKHKKVPMLKHYTVFNVTQCGNVNYPTLDSQLQEHEPIERCEKVVHEMPNPPNFDWNTTLASYQPSTDTLRISPLNKFDSPEAYYSVLFHELVHSTGHNSRLDRPSMSNKIVYGSRTYSNEELLAEMGASFLCGHTGIENEVIDNSAAYIQGWLTKLRAHNTLIVKVAGQAQKAADHILNKSIENYVNGA